MSMVEFAENELKLLLDTCTDEEAKNVQKVINKDILDIIKLFSEQGHSGFSAHYSMNILKRLMDYKPLSPITDNENEWTKLDYDNDLAFQCKRCPSLFKDSDGRVYNVEGRIFSDDNGHTWYTNGNSRIYVTLPYSVPDKPEYVILDTKQQRNAVLTNIINTISNINDTKLKSLDNNQITEDTPLENLLDNNYFDELEKTLFEQNNIIKPLYHIKDCDEPMLWNIINIIINSDKEIPTKANT